MPPRARAGTPGTGGIGMSRATCVGFVFLTVLSAGVARAETYSLAEVLQSGDCFDVHLTLKVSGEMTVAQEGQPIKLKLATQAEHRFRERVLAVQKDAPLV